MTLHQREESTILLIIKGKELGKAMASAAGKGIMPHDGRSIQESESHVLFLRLTLAFSGRGKMVERHKVHDPDADADRVR